MLTSILSKIKKYGNRIRARFTPDYDKEMGVGCYFLEDGRPDIAILNFQRASQVASSKEGLAEALIFHSFSRARAHRVKLATLAHEHVRDVIDDYKTAVELHPSHITFYHAALVALNLGERKDFVAYLEKAVEVKPDDDVLIRVGRLATTFGLHGLAEKVREELDVRGLSIHLYPL